MKISLKSFSKSITSSNTRYGKFLPIILSFDMLKMDYNLMKMYTQRLAGQTLEDILSFSLYTKKTNKRLLFQHGT